ncbi:SHOCT domain-containing protein [Antrihabitans stalactiti]|uniref:SHOCT domain-containing protein n=1 Tax=Antrihabitans stalactiti TaxID=2584121 RepID=A0A848KHQ3_9NOCA|nr:SHOCT domain-containing protein [Antrihabitans stalactiti]NMN98275.1 SHOCT domain-containing protein [Antrihabitans stalactiti]
MEHRYPPEVDQALKSVAERYGLSLDSVQSLFFAVGRGGGRMAQFSIPELGGSGQWMLGGMTMVGNMFDHGLKARVDALCNELATLWSSMPTPRTADAARDAGFSGDRWWPEELGVPSSSGGQNETRYAYFPRARRLAISSAGRVTVYDTLEHSIGGVSQQQGSGPSSLQFSSQVGTFSVSSLPVVEPTAVEPTAVEPTAEAPTPAAPTERAAPESGISADSIISSIEALAGLHARGILSDDEFSAKKAELLSRL